MLKPAPAGASGGALDKVHTQDDTEHEHAFVEPEPLDGHDDDLEADGHGGEEAEAEIMQEVLDGVNDPGDAGATKVKSSRAPDDVRGVRVMAAKGLLRSQCRRPARRPEKNMSVMC